jgi:aryl-alcohol dehydrogenase-like predicted oxidoreductase/predicted kinase
MRLPGDDAPRAAATIAAAAGAGITVFDTARAYGNGDNERQLAAALRACGADHTARVVTKGGMTRPSGAWVPDGRARAIRADCEASLQALGGLPIDLYLLHAPDPRTPWRTSVRALARLADQGLVRRVGLSNVNRDQLEEALALAPIAAVQVALSPVDDRALRGGLLDRCAELGISLIAHSPLGGPQRAPRLLRAHELAAPDAAPAEVALAWLLSLSPTVVAIPGATRPETACSAARAATLALDERQRTALSRARGRPTPTPAGDGDGEVVLVMGIPGAGKTRLAETYLARGYTRLNRDERGGRLRDVADALEEQLAAGHRRVVLDNTYLTRASRSYVIDAAGQHGVPVRCLWLRTPLAQAQVNLVARLIRDHGSLPGPEELGGGRPGVMAPTSQMRALRELEAPAAEEGFAAIEVVEFKRAAGHGGPGVLVAAAALRGEGWERLVDAAAPGAPHLVFDWSEDRAGLDDAVARLAERVPGGVQDALCPHGGGPPRCWCRPPLPGLPLAFAHQHGIDPARCIVIGSSAAHRTLATTLGARYVTAVA